MTELLAGLGIVGGLGVVAAIVTLAFKLLRAKNDQIAAIELLRSKEQAYDELERDRDGMRVERDTAREALRKERDLRAAVESERNDAYRRARDYYADRIKNAGIGDAIRLVDDLFRMPLPGVVPDARVSAVETVPAGDPARTDDDLIKP